MHITLTEAEKQIVTQLNHSMVTVEFLEEWINRQETNVDGRNPYGAEMVALAKGYYTAVQRLAALLNGESVFDFNRTRSQEIRLRCREDNTWEQSPYITIDCATAEDFLYLQEAVKFYNEHKCQDKNERNIQ